MCNLGNLGLLLFQGRSSPPVSLLILYGGLSYTGVDFSDLYLKDKASGSATGTHHQSRRRIKQYLLLLTALSSVSTLSDRKDTLIPAALLTDWLSNEITRNMFHI